MRTEQEMLSLILETARTDERIRAVMLNGSRANPNARRDPFQDYDIVYFVTEVSVFTQDPAWLNQFGEMMIMQTPEAMFGATPGDHFTYLMQFMDGTRIDLALVPIAKRDAFLKDSLSVLLLDKDGIIPPLLPANESDYLPNPPTAKAYADCCNEFWWVSTYVAKGLWRQEITYAKYMLDEIVRVELMKMLTWHIGIETNFAKNAGKYGKYFQEYLAPERWEMLLQTYSDANHENTWRALFAMCELFRQTAGEVAAHFHFEYPRGEDARVTAYLECVQSNTGLEV